MRERIANEASVNVMGMFLFLILIIGVSILSLSVSIPMINEQTASAKMTDSAQMMGTCAVGVESPCNGSQWSR
jgi:hypothetical protein